MELISYTLAELTPERVHDAFRTQQSIIVRGAVEEKTTRDAYAFFKDLMRDAETLARYPFNPHTRVGYTPPGIESLQRDSKKPDWNRSMFDVGPSLMLDDPSVAALYQEAVGICQILLVHLDRAFSSNLSKLPKGGHTLRAAQSLREGAGASEVLFPRHRDFSLLTAFIGSGVPGLEAQVDAEWYPVKLAYGDVLIGAGTPLTQILPEVHSFWHRVVGGADFRLSSFLFFDLHQDVVLPKTMETYGERLERVLKRIRT